MACLTSKSLIETTFIRSHWGVNTTAGGVITSHMINYTRDEVKDRDRHPNVVVLVEPNDANDNIKQVPDKICFLMVCTMMINLI